MRPEDREHLDRFERTPELLADFARRAHSMLVSLRGADPSDLDLVEEPGACDECGRIVRVRFVVGQFAVCRGCAGRRRRAVR
jgi:hypothetical protein